MLASADAARRKELGEFVRACRERLSPESLGLPAGTRRRTPGLRREEVAQLSGLSATWYTWLEQGRDISVSAAALVRLSDALRLARAERAYLFELAARRDPGRERADTATPPPAALEACVHAVGVPAYILDRTWNAVAWNALAAELFVGWLDQPAHVNLLRYIFLSDTAHRLIHDYSARTRRVVSEFRADLSTQLDDPVVRDLVGGLQRESPLFARLWEEHSVLDREGGHRVFAHPTHGLIAYDQMSFDVSGQKGLRLTMLLPRPANDGAPAKPPRAVPSLREAE